MQTTPKKINTQAQRLLSFLGLDPSSAEWLKLHAVKDFTPEPHNCFANCMVQQKLHGGQIGFGWVIWQDTTKRFVEAEFHCVWRDPDGNNRDITPRGDGEKRICFLADPNRQGQFDMSQRPHVTRTYANVKMTGDKIMHPVQRMDILIQGSDLLKSLKDSSNQASHATSEPAPGAASSSHQG